MDGNWLFFLSLPIKKNNNSKNVSQYNLFIEFNKGGFQMQVNVSI